MPNRTLRYKIVRRDYLNGSRISREGGEFNDVAEINGYRIEALCFHGLMTNQLAGYGSARQKNRHDKPNRISLEREKRAALGGNYRDCFHT